MNVLGIIAEYNPFHNGHSYHLEKAKELTKADVTVAVISGDFVQRGEPALINKWKRSEMAVKNGVDLVLELPFCYACNNAEIFAKGSVGLLEGLGIVSSMCFGSEAGDLDKLSEISDIVTDEPDGYTSLLKEKLKKGISFPKARQEALADHVSKDKVRILESPNNTLGIEYLKQLNLLGSVIKPHTIKREGAGIDQASDDSGIAGATAIRKMIDEGRFENAMKFLPEESRNIMSDSELVIVDFDMFREVIFYSILTKSEDELKEIYSVTEGLENRIMKGAKEAKSLIELIAAIKSKRYTETRIKRVLMHNLIGLTRGKMTKILSEEQNYARVLAFNKKGAETLKYIKKNETASIPVITNISKERDYLADCRELFAYDQMAADIYNLVTSNSVFESSDYRKIPDYAL